MMKGIADLHTHTKYSGMSKILFLELPDCVSEPREVVEAAERRGLNVLCVTDHNSIRGGLEAQKYAKSVEVVVGEEILTADGELLGLFLSENVPKGLSVEETIDIVHGMGGVAIAPHPFSSHCSALGDRILNLNLDGVEVFNAFHRDRYSNDLAMQKCRGIETALTGSSDAHAPMMVGDCCTTFEGTTAEDLRKAIMNKKTNYEGRYTSLKDIVWMTTILVRRLQSAIFRSMIYKECADDAEYIAEVWKMRKITKLISLAGSVAFLIPPTSFVASVIGDRLHTSHSRLNWLQHNGDNLSR